MAGYFVDSSALAKLYHTELGSSAVETIVLRSANAILISRLSVVEIQSVFASKARSGLISAGEVVGLRHRFLEDIAHGAFRVVALTNEHYDEAGELIQRHGGPHGLRTLDSLQLAVALNLHGAGVIDSLVSADKVLSRVAALEGIPGIDPEAAVAGTIP